MKSCAFILLIILTAVAEMTFQLKPSRLHWHVRPLYGDVRRVRPRTEKWASSHSIFFGLSLGRNFAYISGYISSVHGSHSP